MEIVRGRAYRAKKPRQAGFGYVNDRQVLWVGESTVQYDSPSMSNGRRYPSIDKEKFEKWAGTDVTDILPEGDWQTWAEYLKKTE
jgi:hypothetical protein